MFFPHCSTVIWGAPRVVAGAPKGLAGAPRWSQACCRRTLAFHWRSQLLWRPAGMPSYGLILSWNLRIQVFTPHPLRHSWRLPVTKIHFADVLSTWSTGIHWYQVLTILRTNTSLVTAAIYFALNWITSILKFNVGRLERYKYNRDLLSLHNCIE